MDPNTDGNVLPNGTDVKNNSDQQVSVVWENVDCGLSSEKLKVLSTAWDLEKDTKQQSVRSTSDAGANSKSRLQSSFRRTSTPDNDDFEWIRKIELRSDVPIIDEIRDWSFDVLQFEDTVLVNVFVSMLEYYNLLEEFQLDRATLERYATAVMQMHNKDCYYQRTDIEAEGVVTTKVELGQHSDNECNILCEYHNWYHAVSCAHACFLFLTLGEVDQFLDSKDIFSIIMGALIHDLDHPGNNNDFEVKRGTELAQRYSNDAVLERHAIKEGLKLCKENSELDWLNSFGREDREYVEKFIAEAVLATDPARHGKIVREALSFVEGGRKAYGSETNRMFFNRNDAEHRLFLGRLFLHSADIANPLHSSFEVARDWAVRVTTEFSRQVSKERDLQLPVTSFMDGLDNEYSIAKVQISFFGFMVQPLYDAIGKLFPQLSHLNDWGERNCDAYREVIKAYGSKHAEAS